jgi:hypothetical protein
MGQILLRNGQEKSALVWFGSALCQNPQHRPTLDRLAEYYSQKGRPDLVLLR